MGATCRPFEKHEVPKVLNQFTNRYKWRDKGLLALGICTGFRVGELVRLRVDDVYHRGNVHKTLDVPKRFMKGDQPRPSKKIFPDAVDYLEKWYTQLRDEFNGTLNSYVFLSERGGRLLEDSVWRIIKTAARESTINPKGIGTHSMRKTFANAVYDYWLEEARDGARVEPMRMVQLELGHSNIEDTYRYMKFKMEQKPDNVFEDYFGDDFEMSMADTG